MDSYSLSLPLRGKMLLHLNEHGHIVDAHSHVPGNQYCKHVFLTSLNRQPGRPWDYITVQDYYWMADWDLVWDVYVGDGQSRDAILTLCGGRLPPLLDRLRSHVRGLSLYVPKNGGGLDGPFSVTTDYRISCRSDLEDALNRLNKIDLNALLHSSHIRSV